MPFKKYKNPGKMAISQSADVKKLTNSQIKSIKVSIHNHSFAFEIGNPYRDITSFVHTFHGPENDPKYLSKAVNVQSTDI